MNETELIRRFEELVDEMRRTRSWGKIEVSFQNGQAETIRKEVTEKLRGTTYETRRYQNHSKPDSSRTAQR